MMVLFHSFVFSFRMLFFLFAGRSKAFLNHVSRRRHAADTYLKDSKREDGLISRSLQCWVRPPRGLKSNKVTSEEYSCVRFHEWSDSSSRRRAKAFEAFSRRSPCNCGSFSGSKRWRSLKKYQLRDHRILHRRVDFVGLKLKRYLRPILSKTDTSGKVSFVDFAPVNVIILLSTY